MAGRRSYRARKRREQIDRGSPIDPGAAIRLSGFVAVLLLFVAVGAGFQGERFTSMAARVMSRLGPLAEPLVFGVSALEFIGAGAVIALMALTVWRLRR